MSQANIPELMVVWFEFARIVNRCYDVMTKLKQSNMATDFSSV